MHFWKMLTGSGRAVTKSWRLWKVSLGNLEGLKSKQLESFSSLLSSSPLSSSFSFLLPSPLRSLLQKLNLTVHLPCLILRLLFYPHHTPYAASTFIILFSAHLPTRTLRCRGSSCPCSCAQEIRVHPLVAGLWSTVWAQKQGHAKADQHPGPQILG